jgi:hypothetical protein
VRFGSVALVLEGLIGSFERTGSPFVPGLAAMHASLSGLPRRPRQAEADDKAFLGLARL